MDAGTIELVRQLLLRAGMAMEDFCHIAVLSPNNPDALIEATAQIAKAVVHAGKFVSAAETLIPKRPQTSTRHGCIRSRGLPINEFL
ncbi:hypothetical protein [Sphingomonas endolithica]|uniref:hypothetical protein n=1 Tax=Sphingomonas endolithica TaxID=2972485 RepID=UPI0021B07EB5|nr:hypothetical protein [Sphingomonas sp. ZFBP2030]